MDFTNTKTPYFNNVEQQNRGNLSKYSDYNISNKDVSDLTHALPSMYQEAIDAINNIKTNSYTPDQLAAANNDLNILLSKIESFEGMTPNGKSVKEGLVTIDGGNEYTNSIATPKNNPYYTNEPTKLYTGVPVNDSGYINGIDETPINAGGKVNEINNNKITPLVNELKTYDSLISQINANYNQKNGIIDKTNNLNSLYDVLNHNSKYDFSGNLLNNITSYNPTIQDAIVEDTSVLAYNENSLYVLGTMTAAVMLIIAVYIARE
jgi:hypothetical protein